MSSSLKSEDIQLRLVQLYNEKMDILSDRGKSPFVELKKRDAWLSITHAINSEFAVKFTSTQIKDKYKYIKSSAKRKLTENKIEFQKTGGGPLKRQKVSNAEELVIDKNKDKPSFSGLPFGVESEKENFVDSENHSFVDLLSDSVATVLDNSSTMNDFYNNSNQSANGQPMHTLSTISASPSDMNISCSSNSFRGGAYCVEQSSFPDNNLSLPMVATANQDSSTNFTKKKKFSTTEIQRMVLEKEYAILELKERVLLKAEKALDMYLSLQDSN